MNSNLEQQMAERIAELEREIEYLEEKNQRLRETNLRLEWSRDIALSKAEAWFVAQTKTPAKDSMRRRNS